MKIIYKDPLVDRLEKQFKILAKAVLSHHKNFKTELIQRIKEIPVNHI